MNDASIDGEEDGDILLGFGGQIQRARMKASHITGAGGEASLAIHPAAIDGHLEVAKYLQARAELPGDSEEERASAARRASITQYVISEVCGKTDAAPVSHQTMIKTARGGHLEVVQWLYSVYSSNRDVDLFRVSQTLWGDEYAMDVAASNGHLAIVQYLHEMAPAYDVEISQDRKRKRVDDEFADEVSCRTGIRCSTAAMNGAATGNHLDVVKWLHANRTEGCTTEAMDNAAHDDHLEMVQWLHENRPEGCTTEAMDSAGENGLLEMTKWLHENTSAGCTTRAMDGAAAIGSLEVVKFLQENRTEGCTSAAMDRADNVAVIRWLNRNRSLECTEEAMINAACDGRLDVMEWLHTHQAENCSAPAIDDAALSGEFEAVLFLHPVRNEQLGDQAGEDRTVLTTSGLKDWVLEQLSPA